MLFFSDATISNFLPNTSWVILSPVEQSIKQKIEAIGTPLKDWDIQINYGIKTGYNEAFIIDKDTKDNLIKEDPKSAEVLRPILRGRDIKKYTAEFAELYLIATLPSLKLDIDNYPAVKKYLLSFGKNRLEQSGGKDSRKKTNNKWFETQDAISYWNDFQQKKVVWLTISDASKFALDNTGYYCLDSTFFLTGDSLHLIIGCLNSKLIEWYYDGICPSTGVGTNQWKKFAMEQIPIPINIDEAPFILLVEQIINNKSLNLDTQDLEIELNNLVYKIYGLTDNEIAIIRSL